MNKTEHVNLDTKCGVPSDYHCSCEYCTKLLGVLQREDGTFYSRIDRRKYYSPLDVDHIAKTPLHIARWAVQAFTEEGDWVFDPTIGSGTTAVEALNHGRNAAGIEIEYADVIRANIAKNNPRDCRYWIEHGDARNAPEILEKIGQRYKLIVNNPPYSGDQQALVGEGNEAMYDLRYANLAFEGENENYWTSMRDIYAACADHLIPGGRFVVGIKDMMRQKKPYLLHKMFADMMSEIPGLVFEGVALLKHHPTTLFMNTYEKRYGVPCPMYQTIVVFKKI